MAKAKAKAKKAARPRTEDLPGVEGPGVAPVRIPEVDRLADDYIKERDKRVRLTPREIAAKQKLIEALHEHKELTGPDGTLTYRYDTVLITLEPGKEKLKVKDVTEEEQDLEE